MIHFYDINYRLYSPYRTKSDISTPYGMEYPVSGWLSMGIWGCFGNKNGFSKTLKSNSPLVAVHRNRKKRHLPFSRSYNFSGATARRFFRPDTLRVPIIAARRSR